MNAESDSPCYACPWTGNGLENEAGAGRRNTDRRTASFTDVLSKNNLTTSSLVASLAIEAGFGIGVLFSEVK